MTKYYRVNVVLLSFECHKLKSATKNATEATLRFSSTMTGTNVVNPRALGLVWGTWSGARVWADIDNGNEVCTGTIGPGCVDTIRINSSSISCKHRNS